MPPALLEVSDSPRILRVDCIWLVIASLRERKCREIVWSASAVYGFDEPGPATVSNEETTICI